VMSPTPLFASKDIYQRVAQLYARAPKVKGLRSLSVSCYALIKEPLLQTSFLEDEQKKRSLTLALDTIAERWGDFAIAPALMMGMEGTILDRIAFGTVKDMDELIWQDEITHEPVFD